MSAMVPLTAYSLNGSDLLWGLVAAVLFLALLGRIARSPR